MSSTVLDPLPVGSIDRFGLSVATATRDGTARKGTVYEPARFAAGVPVHFHPLGGSNFLGLYDGYWSAGTPSTTAAGRYTAKTAVARPAAIVVNAATGQLSVPSSLATFTLPISNYSSLRLNSAASSTNFVMTLCTGDSRAVLTHWNVTRDAHLERLGEYVIPDIVADGQTVRFDRGVYFDQPWIYVWGAGLTDHRIYTARQYLSKLGQPWLYQTDSGWSLTGATPSTTVTTLGPMSTVLWRKVTLITTVATSGSNKVGQIWSTASASDPWIKRAEVVIDTTAAWTGNGLMLQPQVAVNPAIVDPAAIGSIPLLRTAHLGSAGNESLVVSWDLYAVPLSMA